MQPGRERSGPANFFGSKRELFRRRITVLLAARRAVLFFGGFVQLEVAARSPNTPARLFPRTLALARPMHVVGGMGDGQLNQART